MESANLRILPRMKVTFEVGDVHPSSSNHLSYDEDSNSSVSWSWNRRCQGWCWDPNVRPALLVMYSLRKQYGTGSLCVDIYIYIFYMIVYTLVINSLCDTNTTCFLFFLCVHIHMCIYIYMYNTWHMDLCCQSDPYRQCWQFVTWIKTGVPSGKRLHNYGKIHHCSWEIPLFRLGHFQ